MKKVLVFVMAIAMMTAVACAAEDTVEYQDTVYTTEDAVEYEDALYTTEDTVEYEGTAYTYGGFATETTDDNENGRIDGLLLRGVDTPTYYTAGDGFVYFIPATEDEPAVMTLDNATLVADYCIHAVTDVNLILVGDNLLQSESTELLCFQVAEMYDSNMERLDAEDGFYGALSIEGEGSLSVVSAGTVGLYVGRLAIYSGDVSVTLDDGVVAVCAVCSYETDSLTGFLMEGGTLDIDLGESDAWGLEVLSGDIDIRDGMINIHGGGSDCAGMMVGGVTKDVTMSITGGTTIIENNSAFSLAATKYDEDLTAYAVVDFSDAPDGVLQLAGMFQFCDAIDVSGEAGTVEIAIFDAAMVQDALQLTVTGLTDYVYCINGFTSWSQEDSCLSAFTASMVGQPSITENIRVGLVYPYTTGVDPYASYTFTRAQVIALLWDSMGCPAATIDNPFTDVNAEDGYYEAVLWAVEQGIATGTTDTTFAPDALCTKGELLTFLYCNAGQPEVDVENIFADVDSDSDVYDAVLWGIANEMMDLDTDAFHADSTELNDGAVAYLICMF